ncbi:hypothetical protein JD844_016616 [Phrynosoma platyrhinos]|uniref:CAP-Gly domain-containing protein n=1 Tax=Phrynosoma platyrhinos TaxID=52577 RepID=A0ABQ7SKT1_PHRPL|nr:hypothetical protein JD844_016616 [Phrynosoma platyrhinos]
MRVTGAAPERVLEGDDSSENSSESGSLEIMDNNGEIIHRPKKLTCRVIIKEATGLPLNLSNFVFCQYTFWDQCESTVAAPVVDPDVPSPLSRDAQFTVTFSHCKAPEQWNEVTRRIEMWVSIQELNEMGDYMAVELHPAKDVNTGGVFQLRQGHSRRVQVVVKPVQHSGTLPLMVEAILSVSIGCVTARSTKLQRGLDSYQRGGGDDDDGDMDSYQEEDLNCLRERWSEALIKRREYLDEQIKKISSKQEKSEDDIEREARLVEQWVGLTEERNAVLVPAPDSGIPGAPANWIPPSGMETHVPVLFLDLNADDLSANEHLIGPNASGLNSILPKEHGSQFFYLPIIKHSKDEVSATAAWDSSVHDSVHLNRVTPQNERIYLIVKITVQLSHPAAMELMLRKRIAANIYNKQSFTQSLKRRISMKNVWYACGVTYEIVSNIPKATEEILDRETLALMAAKNENEGTSDGETYIEKYTRGVLQVENILSLERLRQVSSSRLDLSGVDEDKPDSLRPHGSINMQVSLCPLGCQGSYLTSRRLFSTIATTPMEMPLLTSMMQVGWSEGHLDVLECSSSYQDVSCYGTLPRESPRRNKDAGGYMSENPHPSTVSPFKAFSPQPPKFFKPLMPVKEENKKTSLETRPLLSKESMPSSQVHNAGCVVPSGSNVCSMPVEPNSMHEEKIQDSEEDDELEAINKKPYVPEEFADFSVYNASLENREWLSSKGDFVNSRVLEKEVSRSPTTSSITSGYFSHSASNATLSDMLVPCSDSTDQLANQIRDLDLNDHSTAHLTYDLKSSNKETSEPEKDLAKYSRSMSPVKGNGALAIEIPVFEGAGTDASKLHYSSSESSANKNRQQGIEFPSQETTVEHTSNVFEDHAFTEFMGVDDGKELEYSIHPPFSSSGGSSRRTKLSTAGMNHASGLHKNAHNQNNPVRHLECLPVGYQLSNSIEDPLLAVRIKEASFCQTYADSLIAEDFTRKSLTDASHEDTTSEKHSNWVAVGEQVYIGSDKTGIVRYVGPVDFSTSTWVGVELHFPVGKHDGTVKGKEYFRCKPRHGVFVRPECLTKAPAPTKTCSSTSQSQVSSNMEKWKSSVLQGSSSFKTETGSLCQSGDAAASAFSRKQEIRKSWIN